MHNYYRLLVNWERISLIRIMKSYLLLEAHKSSSTLYHCCSSTADSTGLFWNHGLTWCLVASCQHGNSTILSWSPSILPCSLQFPSVIPDKSQVYNRISDLWQAWEWPSRLWRFELGSCCSSNFPAIGVTVSWRWCGALLSIAKSLILVQVKLGSSVL